MEKLLEQEALMEQQDPKVGSAGLLRWPWCERGPDGSAEASRREGQEAGFARDPYHFLVGLGNGKWIVIHSLLCSTRTRM